MKVSLKKSEINGIKFYHREGTSDLKTFEEVVGRKTYLKRGNTITDHQHWYDCGANVGAFATLACSLGAQVSCFEPDPFNCEMLEKNLKLNGFTAHITQAALVHDDTKETTLFVGNNGNVWRNSILKNWNGKGIKVPCVNFDEVVKGGLIKMDIEGMEMPIIETTKNLSQIRRIIFEWSFDIDPNLERYWKMLDRMGELFEVKASTYRDKGVTVWPQAWFPACENVFCYAKA